MATARGTFNISTAAALLVASTGVTVAKHGNRAITSRSGSADVLDALGVRIDHTAESAAVALRALGFAFLFAPSFHPAMRHAGPTRREIGIRTSFNLLGPLTNPAGATRALLGVGDAAAAERIAEVASCSGRERTLVVHGAGVDELPLDGTGVIHDVGGDGPAVQSVDPAALGLVPAATSELAGGSAEDNAAMIEAIFAGEAGPRRDVVLLNAGAALVAADVGTDLADGIAAARNALDTGMPRDLLARLREERTAARVPGGRREPRMTVETRPKRGGPSQGGRDPGGNGPDATRAAGRAGIGLDRARDRRGVVGEIAARRLADLRPALEAIDRAMLRRQVAAAPAPRPFADRLAAPGLHLIAEIKRRSPSAGEIASMGEDIVARARAYQAGGAAAISVLCEPHWFGGSVEDLATVRSAVSIPVLAKEFVVDARQLDLLRAAGADAVLLLAVLHPRRGLAKLVGQALDLGLEPLVEAHGERELERALSTRARVIGHQQPRPPDAWRSTPNGLPRCAT